MVKSNSEGFSTIIRFAAFQHGLIPGNRSDAIAQQGHRSGRTVQSSFKDLVPLAHRTDVDNAAMERPSEEDVANTASRTQAALEKLLSNRGTYGEQKCAGVDALLVRWGV